MSATSETRKDPLPVAPSTVNFSEPPTPSRAHSASGRIPDEQVHSSACGSAIEINYDDESRPDVIPFFPEWAWGSRPKGRVLNLSFNGQGLVAYSSAHVVVLYDYKTHSQRLLLGHVRTHCVDSPRKNTISAIAADSSGAWMVSADAGVMSEPSCVIVWNLKDASLHRVLPGQAPEQGYHLVGMSADGQLAAAVAAGPRRAVHLWSCHDELSSGPAAVVSLPESLGHPKGVTFDADAPTCFLVTCELNVAFMAWSGGTLHCQPGELTTKCPGKLVDSTYQCGTRNAVSVSDRGFVVLWTDPPVHAPSTKVSRKVYCIEKDGLTAVTEVDSMVVIGTRRGHIRFYDQDMYLLHWYEQSELDAIVYLSFHLDAPTDTDLSWVGSRSSFPTVRHSVDVEQRGVQERLDLSRLISGPSPRQLDVGDPFLARDLIVSTTAGRVVLVSFVNQRCVILQDNQNAVTILQAHPERPILMVGKANDSISAIDYVKKETIASYTFERKPGTEPLGISALSYSPNGLVLACGRTNGTLYMLHPVLLHPIQDQPFHRTHHTILNLCFSPDNMHMAHCDSANFVSAYRCHNAAEGRWMYLGKKQLHGLPVRSLLFGPQPVDAPLFSLGEDMILIEYDVARSMNNSLFVTRMDRVEQSGVPSSCTWCPGDTEDDDLLLLIATSEFKYKMVNLRTRQLCGTAQGPRLQYAVNMIKTIGGTSVREPATAVYSTMRRLGLQCLPPDGNPFRTAALMAHPQKVTNFIISPCEEFVFSSGIHDPSVIMWRILPEAVQAIHAEDNEEGLDPWLLAVDGGRDGWLIKVMQDMFCYAQLLHQGAFSTEPRCITDRLPVCEVPDVMRALGYFPSQFEINSMVSEVLRRHGETISSTDLVKLYVNHKPMHDLTAEQLREAFSAFVYPNNKATSDAGEVVMTKEKFLSVLMDKGEDMDMDEVQGVLRVLLKGAVAMDSDADGLYSHLLMDEAAQREKLFFFLPDTITFDFFVDTILGAVRK